MICPTCKQEIRVGPLVSEGPDVFFRHTMKVPKNNRGLMKVVMCPSSHQAVLEDNFDRADGQLGSGWSSLG